VCNELQSQTFSRRRCFNNDSKRVFKIVRRDLSLLSKKVGNPRTSYVIDLINARGYGVSSKDPCIQKAKIVAEESLKRKIPLTGNLVSTDMNYQLIEGKILFQHRCRRTILKHA